MFVPTTATRELLKLDKRIRIVAGGTSAGKTISILQILIDYAQSTGNQLISVVSESFPHLRRGAMRDFLNIMEDQGYFNPDRWSKTDFTYSFETGSRIEFFSADQPGKVRGPRRDVLFVNEGNNIDYESFDQLRIRTRKIIWLDFNPTAEFWAYTDVMPNYEHDFVTLTYKDNEALDASIVQDIEAHKHNKAWWTVYGLGQLGEVEGKVFTGWRLDLNEIPHEARLERRGLDFGYSNDPTALIDVYYYNGGFILNERLYQKGLTNKQIADFILNGERPEVTVYADSAEPKSIDELRLYGVNVVPAQKGPGSITQGIDYVRDQRVSVTKWSLNIIKEYRNYMWAKDRDGNYVKPPKPEDMFNHAMDALRYALEGYARASTGEVGIADASLARRGNESFLVDEEGNAVNFQIDLLEAAKKSEQGPQDWRYQ